MIARISSTVACALGLATSANAGTLVTSPVNVGFGGPATGVNCSVANVGKKSLDVLVEVLDGLGGTPASQTISLLPGGSGGDSHFAGGFFYCRFTFKGSNKQVRAALQAIDSNSSPYSSEAAR